MTETEGRVPLYVRAARESYFDWMYHLVCEDRYTKKTYRKLLMHLHSTPFTWTIEGDKNRLHDGVNLRWRFERQYRSVFEGRDVADILGDPEECSVLEMMIALAIRCENQIMADPDAGDRTGQWFWEMIVNLNLGREDDRFYNPEYVDGVLQTFLRRTYKRDGAGGLFRVKGFLGDMRTIEIWYQMCHYLAHLTKDPVKTS